MHSAPMTRDGFVRRRIDRLVFRGTRKRRPARHRALGKAVTLAGKGKTDRAERLRTQAAMALDAIGTKVAKAAARKASKHVSAECRAAFDGLIASRRAVLDGFPL